MKGLRNIQHSMSMVLTTRFHIWFIIKLYYKMRQILSINATAFLSQNSLEIYYKMHQVFFTKCDSYNKMRRFYYKTQRLLQIAAVYGVSNPNIFS